MKTKILAIAPYPGLVEVLQACAAENPDVVMTIHTGDLNEGVRIATSMSNQHFDVIISRGGTASLIKQYTHTPVVAIQPSVYDLLRVIRLAQGYEERFAIVAFSNITRDAKLLFSLMRQNVDLFTVTDTSNCQKVVTALKKQGYTLILGDNITTEVCRQKHVNTLLITSGRESVSAAIDEACRLHQSIADQLMNIEMERAVINTYDLQVVVYDKEGNLRYFNHGLEDASVPPFFTRLPALVGEVLRYGDLRQIRRAGTNFWHVRAVSISVREQEYAVFYIKQISCMQANTDNALQLIHLFDTPQGDSGPIDNIGAMRRIYDQLHAIAQFPSPIVMYGYTEGQFDAPVRYLHRHGRWHTHMLLRLDCRLITKKYFHYLMKNENSLLNENEMTVVIQCPEALNEEQALLLYNYLNDTKLCTRCRVVLCTLRPMDDHPLAALLYTKNGVKISLPSLNERREDIDSLITLLLNQINQETGKQIIQLEKEASDILRNFEYTGELLQLKRMLLQAALLTDGDTITCNAVSQVLHNEHGVAGGWDVSKAYSGTMEQINQRVVRYVLEQEGGNRTRTVERLGISRSTLWRILERR